MKIEGSVALVTGANRGLGAAFCRTLLDRGAAKVYAGARDLADARPRRRDPRASSTSRRRRTSLRRPSAAVT